MHGPCQCASSACTQLAASPHPCRRACRREGNGWSYDYCRRQWSLADAEDLRYRFLNAWDAALQALDAKFGFLASTHQIVSFAGDKEQVLVGSSDGWHAVWTQLPWQRSCPKDRQG